MQKDSQQEQESCSFGQEAAIKRLAGQRWIHRRFRQRSRDHLPENGRVHPGERHCNGYGGTSECSGWEPALPAVVERGEASSCHERGQHGLLNEFCSGYELRYTCERLQIRPGLHLCPEAVLRARQALPQALQTPACEALPSAVGIPEGAGEIHHHARGHRKRAGSLLEVVLLVSFHPAEALSPRHHPIDLRIPFPEDLREPYPWMIFSVKAPIIVPGFRFLRRR